MSTNSFVRSLAAWRLMLASLIVALLAVALFGLPALVRADFSYTVKSGDNLSKIARVNNTTVEALVAANKAKFPCLATNPACLQIGWVITIPSSGGSVNTGATGPSIYTVQSGDSLAKIAKKLGVDFNALIAANKKDRPCLAATPPCALQIGWVLNVPGGSGQPPAAAPTTVPTTVATTAPAAAANTQAPPVTAGTTGQLIVVMCQDIEVTITIFHGGQIIKQGSLHRQDANVYDLAPGHYDVQFNASGYFNLNLGYDIEAGGVFTQFIGGVC